MVTFDTNVLVYATASISDAKVPRARELIARAMRAERSVLLLQSLAEFANVAIRKAKIPVNDIRRTIDAWRAVLPVQAADDGDLGAALEAVRAHRLRSGMRCYGLRRNVPVFSTCLLKIFRMALCCRV